MDAACQNATNHANKRQCVYKSMSLAEKRLKKKLSIVPSLGTIPKIGGGSFGDVYKSSWHEYPAAIKLSKHAIDDYEGLDCSFVRECSSLHTLNSMTRESDFENNGVVNLFEVFLPTGQDAPPRLPCLFMEHMEKDLKSYIKRAYAIREGISEDFIRDVMFRLLAAVNNANQHGVAHRDIKPENILLSFSKIVKTQTQTQTETQTQKEALLTPEPRSAPIRAASLGAAPKVHYSKAQRRKKKRLAQVPPLRTPQPQTTQAQLPQPAQAQQLVDYVLHVRLADFGLARMQQTSHSPKTALVCTAPYRPPEILLGETAYGHGVDIWSLGCVMAEMATGKILFDDDCAAWSEIIMLLKILETMGTPKANTIRSALWPTVSRLPHWKVTFPDFPGKDFTKLFPKLSPDAIDLLKGLLALDPAQRLTAAQGLQHPFFDPLLAPQRKITHHAEYHSVQEVVAIASWPMCQLQCQRANEVLAASDKVTSSSWILMQKDMTSIVIRCREILFEWLYEVAAQFKLSIKTIWSAFDLIDRYTCKVPVSRADYQLVGVASLALAMKMHDVVYYEIRDLVHMTDHAYTTLQISAMETKIFSTLGHTAYFPTAWTFVLRLQEAAAFSDTKAVVERLMYANKDAAFLGLHPCLMACAALHNAIRDKYMDTDEEVTETPLGFWGPRLRFFSGCDYDKFKHICVFLDNLNCSDLSRFNKGVRIFCHNYFRRNKQFLTF